MTTSGFLNYSIPNRVRLVLSDKKIEYIYVLLSKHLNKSVDDLRRVYQLKLNHVKQELTISGDMESIAVLFFHLQSLGVNCRSVESTHLRLDVVHFINRVR